MTFHTRFRRSSCLALVGLAVIGGALADEPIKVDAGVPKYTPGAAVTGNLNSIGSDTMNNVMALWAEQFRAQHPSVKVQFEGKGSTTAPPALIKGSAQLGPMSRLMKPEEVDGFEKQFGYKPTAYRVAIDALTVWVNKDNPLEKLTLPEVDAIFSSTRKCGVPNDVDHWGDVGLTGEWSSKPISLYGRNSASGTYGYFKEHALCKGDFKASVKEQPGSSAVVQGVTADKYAIGYSGVGYKTPDVKALAIAAKPGGTYYTEGVQEILSGKYPLSRFLYVYVNKAPGKPLDPLVNEFLKYVLSQQGQEVVVKDGFIPLTAAMVKEELAKLP